MIHRYGERIRSAPTGRWWVSCLPCAREGGCRRQTEGLSFEPRVLAGRRGRRPLRSINIRLASPVQGGSDPSARSAGRSEVSCDRNRELKKRSDAQRPCFGIDGSRRLTEGLSPSPMILQPIALAVEDLAVDLGFELCLLPERRAEEADRLVNLMIRDQHADQAYQRIKRQNERGIYDHIQHIAHAHRRIEIEQFIHDDKQRDECGKRSERGPILRTQAPRGALPCARGSSSLPAARQARRDASGPACIFADTVPPRSRRTG